MAHSNLNVFTNLKYLQDKNLQLVKFYVPIFSVAKWKTQGNMHNKYTTMTLNYLFGITMG